MSAAPTQQQMQSVLHTLMALKYADAFLEPVDWKAWGLLDYPQIVKKPMDLGTMESKLKARKYDHNFDLFKSDLDLVVDNCLLFNEKSSEVYRQAVSLRKAIGKEVGKLVASLPASPPPATPAAAAEKPTGGRKSAASARQQQQTPAAASSSSSSSTPAPPAVVAAAAPAAAAPTPAAAAAALRAPVLPASKPAAPDDKDRFCRQLFNLSAVDLGKVMELVDELCPNAIEGVSNDEVDLNVDAIDGNAFKRLHGLVSDLSNSTKQQRARAE